MFNKQVLIDIANTPMPFGKYKGIMLINLPEPYLIWFARQGFPDNKLGQLLATTLALKTDGLEDLVKPLIKKVSHE